MAPKLKFEEILDKLWEVYRQGLSTKIDVSHLPAQISDLIRKFEANEIKSNELQIVKAVDLTILDDKERMYADNILKLFDASHNSYRSIAYILRLFLQLTTDLSGGEYDLFLKDYAHLNGAPLTMSKSANNKDLCSVCGRYKHAFDTAALITGNPKTDSKFQLYRKDQGKRSASMKVCHYCFTAGWVDLPTSKVTEDSAKGREYLFITTPLSRQSLEELLKLIEHLSNFTEAEEVDEQIESRDTNSQPDFNSFLQALQEKFGIEPSERLAILGFNTRRLRELRGFVLQSSNQLQRTLVLRIPVERLVGEDHVSGSVRRALVKAAMYDFWRITGGSLHYNRVRADATFSVDGQVITLNEMLCANRAYHIANSYGRIGTYRHLNSGLFMLLLSHPRMATNRIFNSKKRENGGRFAPGSQKVKEIIDMTEEIAQHDDWLFQLGLKIVETLVTAGLAPKAKGFWKTPKDQYTGVELVKWIQRIKMARDPDSTRAWGTSVINGYRREHGYGPNSEIVAQILALVGEIITSCQQHNMPLGDFSRTIASMDYYLLFYYNQKQTV